MTDDEWNEPLTIRRGEWLTMQEDNARMHARIAELEMILRETKAKTNPGVPALDGTGMRPSRDGTWRKKPGRHDQGELREISGHIGLDMPRMRPPRYAVCGSTMGSSKNSTRYMARGMLSTHGHHDPHSQRSLP